MHTPRKHEAKRSGFEDTFVGPRGRKRYVPRGELRSTRAYDMEGSPYQATYDLSRLGIPGLVGEVKLQPVRVPLPDGSRGRPVAPADAVAVERLLRAAPEDLLWAARMEVERAITYGELEHCRRRYGVRVLAGGRLLTIPEKGAPTKWASAGDLAQALATGAF